MRNQYRNLLLYTAALAVFPLADAVAQDTTTSPADITEEERVEDVVVVTG